MKIDEKVLRAKYDALRSVLNERTRRLWAATEAEALGHGGIRGGHAGHGEDPNRARRVPRRVGLHHQAAPEEEARSLQSAARTDEVVI